MKILLVLLVAVFAAAQASAMFDLSQVHWKAYKTQHNKTYSSALEEEYRMKIFLAAKEKIAQHNRKFDAGLVSFKLGTNKFADMEHGEFVRMMNGFKKPSSALLGSDKTQKRIKFVKPANVELPESVDWRASGAVTGVKDQGQCGSCWAFSATGSLEGQHFRRTGQLVSLSEQNLVDCSGAYGNYGCSGGWMDQAYSYIRSNGGIDTESSYPYEGRDNRCRFNAQRVGATVSGFVDIQQGSESDLEAAVATVGPIGAAIDAASYEFQLYESGVYNPNYCTSTNLDHGVLVVGYGNEHGQDYWLVKNSWGNSWGLNGYIKMQKNDNNRCGIATSASYPLV